jgi:hypothetical protein
MCTLCTRPFLRCLSATVTPHCQRHHRRSHAAKQRAHLCKLGVAGHRRAQRDDQYVSRRPLQGRPRARNCADAAAEAVAADHHPGRLCVAACASTSRMGMRSIRSRAGLATGYERWSPGRHIVGPAL